MSYCRWSNSDIYLYPDTIDGKIVCFQCQLENEKPEDREFWSRSKALAHVEMHLAFGDNVPERVVERLREELETSGEEIKEEVYEYTSGPTGNVQSLS